MIDLDTIREWLADSPFQTILGIQLESFSKETETLTFRLPFNDAIERAPGSGQHHGGVIASLIDIAGDYAVALQLGGGVPTINFRTDFVRPAFNTDLIAHAKVRRLGRTVAVCDIDVVSEEGKLLAVGRGCYSAKIG